MNRKDARIPLGGVVALRRPSRQADSLDPASKYPEGSAGPVGGVWLLSERGPEGVVKTLNHTIGNGIVGHGVQIREVLGSVSRLLKSAGLNWRP